MDGRTKRFAILSGERALCEGRTTNPAHKDAFKLSISDFKEEKSAVGQKVS